MGPSLESHACLQLVILLSAAYTGECRTCGSPHHGDLSRVAPTRPVTTSVQDEAFLGPLAGVGQDAPIPARTALSGAEDIAQFNLAPHTFDEIMHAPEIMSAPEGSLSHRAPRALFSETRIRSSSPTTHTHSGLRDGAGSRDFPIARHTQQREFKHIRIHVNGGVAVSPTNKYSKPYLMISYVFLFLKRQSHTFSLSHTHTHTRPPPLHTQTHPHKFYARITEYTYFMRLCRCDHPAHFHGTMHEVNK